MQQNSANDFPEEGNSLGARRLFENARDCDDAALNMQEGYTGIRYSDDLKRDGNNKAHRNKAKRKTEKQIKKQSQKRNRK